MFLSRCVYETLYPSEDPPPPLPPRTHRTHQHRPLERTRAIHLSTTTPPPGVPPPGVPPPPAPRHNKPPSLPPRPRKALNPEDSFNIEIIDTDECHRSSRQPGRQQGDQEVPRPARLPLAPLAWGGRRCQCSDQEGAPLATPEQEGSLGGSHCGSLQGGSFEKGVDDDERLAPPPVPQLPHVCMSAAPAAQAMDFEMIPHHGPSTPEGDAVVPVEPQGACAGPSSLEEFITPPTSRKTSVDNTAVGFLTIPESSSATSSSPITPDSGVAPASTGSCTTTNTVCSSSESLGLSTSPHFSQVDAAPQAAPQAAPARRREVPSSTLRRQVMSLSDEAPPPASPPSLAPGELRPHKVLSRQVSHPPVAAELPAGATTNAEPKYLSPRLHRLLSRVHGPAGTLSSVGGFPMGCSTPLPQCPPTPTHHAKPRDTPDRAADTSNRGSMVTSRSAIGNLHETRPEQCFYSPPSSPSRWVWCRALHVAFIIL